MVRRLLGDGFAALTPHLLITSPSAGTRSTEVAP